ncbi:thiamine phosphate synthase [Pendulispora brunnea]|uniref:Thiamine phosphate synthase n=1 Tax=Pendulispora brunnea TaxID=2905690 RepID=A0ABZ2KI68_9BACT
MRPPASQDRQIGQVRLASRVLLITDPSYAAAHVDAVVAVVSGALGPLFAVQLRDKGASAGDLRMRAVALRALTRAGGASFIVNGSPELAAEVGADGVHLPGFAQDPSILGRARAIVGPSGTLYVPVHTRHEVLLARDGGADALLVSPIFDSPGKGPARGVAALAEARALAPLSIYALGGIDASHVAACHRAGADGVAIIRALLDAPDPVATARALISPWTRTAQPSP